MQPIKKEQVKVLTGHGVREKLLLHLQTKLQVFNEPYLLPKFNQGMACCIALMFVHKCTFPILAIQCLLKLMHRWELSSGLA